jgi:hypothetical protein
MNHVDAMKRAVTLCEWISESPHQRGSVNGLAMQVRHELAGAITQAEKQEPVAVVGDGFQLLWARHDWSRGIKVGDKLYTTPPAAQPAPGAYKDVAGTIPADVGDAVALYMLPSIDDILAAQQGPDRLHLAMMDLARKQADRIAELEQQLAEFVRVGTLYSESWPIVESGWRFALGGQQCTGFAVERAVFVIGST